MGQCRTLDADTTIRCYCGDYSSGDNTIPTSLLKNIPNIASQSASWIRFSL